MFLFLMAFVVFTFGSAQGSSSCHSIFTPVSKRNDYSVRDTPDLSSNKFFDQGFSESQKKAIKRQRKRWTGFSNPHYHDNANFRYILTALMEAHLSSDFKDPQAWMDRLREMANFLNLDNPLYNISASLVIQSFTGTVGRVGFILNVPQENIFGATAGDAGILNNMKYASERIQSNHRATVYSEIGLPSPERLIQESTESAYNEVTVSQFIDTTKKIHISAVFIKSSANSVIREAALQISMELQIPLVEIPSRIGAN